MIMNLNWEAQENGTQLTNLQTSSAEALHAVRVCFEYENIISAATICQSI